MSNKARASIKSSKCRECSGVLKKYHPFPVIFLTKKFAATSKFRYFSKIFNFHDSPDFTSDMERFLQISSETVFFYADDASDDVTMRLWIMPLYSCLCTSSTFKDHYLLKWWEYRKEIFRVFMLLQDLDDQDFSMWQVKGQVPGVAKVT